MHRNYAFGHQAGSGKDVARAVLVSEFGYAGLSFAEPVYLIAEHIQELLGLPKEKNRALLQFLGEGLRTVLGQDIWVDYTMRRIHDLAANGRRICISDLRYRNEAEALRKAGFILAQVYRPDRSLLTHEASIHRSETDLLGYRFDTVIGNTGTIEEFRAKIRLLDKA